MPFDSAPGFCPDHAETILQLGKLFQAVKLLGLVVLHERPSSEALETSATEAASLLDIPICSDCVSPALGV